MARSLRSSRRKANKIALRARYKPRYDAQLKSIVANMQENTVDLMDTAGAVDVEGQVEVIDPDKEVDQMEDNGNTEISTENITEKKIKIPKVDIKKVAQFMSQRKYRTYKAKIKKEKKRVKKGGSGGKKKARDVIKW